MVTNGFGNVFNYWIFVTLVSLHLPVLSNHLAALSIAAFTAWLMNYASIRFLVFRRRPEATESTAEGEAPISPPNGP